MEKNHFKYIGNPDIASSNMKTSLTDTVQIKGSKDMIRFSFQADSLYLKPANQDVWLKNNKMRSKNIILRDLTFGLIDDLQK